MTKVEDQHMFAWLIVAGIFGTLTIGMLITAAILS